MGSGLQCSRSYGAGGQNWVQAQGEMVWRETGKKSQLAAGNSQECKFSLAGVFSHNLEVGLAYMGELIVGWETGVLEWCDELQVCRQELQWPRPPVASRAKPKHTKHTAGTPKGSKRTQKVHSHTYSEGGQEHGRWVEKQSKPSLIVMNTLYTFFTCHRIWPTWIVCWHCRTLFPSSISQVCVPNIAIIFYNK